MLDMIGGQLIRRVHVDKMFELGGVDNCIIKHLCDHHKANDREADCKRRVDLDRSRYSSSKTITG